MAASAELQFRQAGLQLASAGEVKTIRFWR